MPFKILPTLAYLGLLLILLALGNWQLGRAEEKRRLLAMQAEQTNSTPLVLTASNPDDGAGFRYKKVQLQGHYDLARQFLLDNQINAGKAGYFVLTPFILGDGQKAVLVNRGWVPLMPRRTELPVIGINTPPTVISGRINQFPAVGIKLAGAELPTESWPSVVQIINSSILGKKLGYDLFSFQVELDPQVPEGYVRTWQTSTLMPPEQHTAYAMQWFALALTLTLLFIVHCFKKIK